MKASDTVMSMKQLSELNSAMPPEARYGEVFEVIAKAQAEISFNAGIKEAERIIWEHSCFRQNSPWWQAKLKEWGIVP